MRLLFWLQLVPKAKAILKLEPSWMVEVPPPGGADAAVEVQFVQALPVGVVHSGKASPVQARPAVAEMAFVRGKVKSAALLVVPMTVPSRRV